VTGNLGAEVFRNAIGLQSFQLLLIAADIFLLRLGAKRNG